MPIPAGPDPNDGWASVGDVLLTTGVTVSSAELAQAGAVVALHVNRTPDSDVAVSARDLNWLKQAVCWQAVWQRSQPGYATRSEVSHAEQDGAVYSYPSRSAQTLAPLAKRAIKNLTWMGNRALFLGVAAAVPAAFTTEASADAHLWSPL